MWPDARETFSTADVSPRERVDRWNSFGSETFARLAADPDDVDGFSARLTRAELGGLGFGWLATTPSIARGLGGVGPWAAPSNDAFLLLVQEQGRSLVQQCGRQALLQDGDLVLWDATRPWLCQALEPMSLVVVKLPIERVLRRIGDPEALAGASLHGGSGAAAFASAAIRSVGPALSGEPEDGLGDSLSDIVLDAVALAFGGPGAGPPERRANALFRREVCAFIEPRLEDPDLSVAAIARGMGVTTRRLQRAFLEGGVGPRQYILQRRLDLAAERLRRGPGGHGHVTEIAFALGFNDPSYFARAFARRHGVSPRAYGRRFTSP